MEKRNDFTITRVLNASREMVFKAFTDPKHLAHWWGPKGCTLSVAKIELKPGGTFLYCMELPGGHSMWGKFVYLEIKAPEKIIFINSFSDKEGNIIRHPMAPTWPLEVYNVWTLIEQNGKTTLTLSGHPHNASDEENKTFYDSVHMMQDGFKGTFDNLEEYLVKM